MKPHEKTIIQRSLLLIALIASAGVVGCLRSLNVPPTYTPPPKRFPIHNGFDDFLAAGEMFSSAGGMPAAPMNPYGLLGAGSGVSQPLSPGTIRQTVSRNRPALARLREGLQKPCKVPLLASVYRSYPHLLQLRDLGGLLALEGAAYERQGLWARAARSYRDCIAFGEAVTRGGGVSYLYIRNLVWDAGGKGLSGCAEHLGPKECRALARSLGAILDRQASFAKIMQNQRTGDLTAISEVFQKENVFQLRKLVEPFGIKELPTVPLPFHKRHAFAMQDSHLQAIIAQTLKPYRLYQPVPPPKDYFSMLVGQDTYDFASDRYRSDLYYRAKLRVLIARLSLRAYRLKRGRYPESLSALVPAYLKALPSDPFNSAPLVYRRKSGHCRVYSIGADLKDDKGMPIPKDDKGMPIPKDAMRDRRRPECPGDITPEW